MTVPPLPAIGQLGWGPIVNDAITEIAEDAGTAAPLAVGTLVGRPAASAASGSSYLATDDNGGTLYYSNGTTWVQEAASVSGSNRGSITTATNATGTATHYSGTGFTDVASTSISVVANTADVWLEWGGVLTQTAAGDSDAFLCLIETTSGSTLLASSVVKLPGNGRSSSFPPAMFQLGAVGSTRTFKVQAFQVIASGTPTWDVLNATTSPTYLTAEAR